MDKKNWRGKKIREETRKAEIECNSCNFDKYIDKEKLIIWLNKEMKLKKTL